MNNIKTNTKYDLDDTIEELKEALRCHDYKIIHTHVLNALDALMLWRDLSRDEFDKGEKVLFT